MRFEILYFWQEDCEPCQTTKPMVERVAVEYCLPVQHIDVRTLTNALLYEVRATPTVMLVARHDAGEEILFCMVGGLINERSLRKLLDNRFKRH
jgi:thiol-disulfide isomerase/thioredoxin